MIRIEFCLRENEGKRAKHSSHFYLNFRRNIDAQIFRGDLVNFLLLGLHNVGQGGVSRFVESEVGRKDGRKGDLDGVESAVDFSDDVESAVVLFDLGRENSLKFEVNFATRYKTNNGLNFGEPHRILHLFCRSPA